MKNPIFLLLLIELASLCSFAQGPPIFTETPIMLGLNGRAIRTFGKYAHGENSRSYTHVVAIPYNITTQFQIGSVVPFTWKSSQGMSSRAGLGDVTLFAKQQAFQIDGTGKTFRMLVKGTTTLPTGNTSGEPAIGSGQWHLGLGIVAGYITTRLGLYAESGYLWISDGMPDEIYYALEASLPLLPQKYPPSQLNLSAGLTASINASSYDQTLFISSGLQYIAGRRFLMETGVLIPVKEDNPDATDTKYIFLLGARMLIF